MKTEVWMHLPEPPANALHTEHQWATYGHDQKGLFCPLGAKWDASNGGVGYCSCGSIRDKDGKVRTMLDWLKAIKDA